MSYRPYSPANAPEKSPQNLLLVLWLVAVGIGAHVVFALWLLAKLVSWVAL